MVKTTTKYESQEMEPLYRPLYFPVAAEQRHTKVFGTPLRCWLAFASQGSQTISMLLGKLCALAELKKYPKHPIVNIFKFKNWLIVYPNKYCTCNIFFFLNFRIYWSIQIRYWGAEDGSAVKCTDCFSRGPQLYS